MGSNRRVLWKGNLEIGQQGLPGLDYKDILKVKVEGPLLECENQPRTAVKETFDWDSGIEKVQVERFKKGCMYSPNRLETFLSKSQVVRISSDQQADATREQERKWDCFRKLTQNNDGEDFIIHLRAKARQPGVRRVYCPIVILKFNNSRNRGRSIGLSLCVGNPYCSRATCECECCTDPQRMQAWFKYFNFGLRVCRQPPPESLRYLSKLAIWETLRDKLGRADSGVDIIKRNIANLEGTHLPTSLTEYLGMEPYTG